MARRTVMAFLSRDRLTGRERFQHVCHVGAGQDGYDGGGLTDAVAQAVVAVSVLMVGRGSSNGKSHWARFTEHGSRPNIRIWDERSVIITSLLSFAKHVGVCEKRLSRMTIMRRCYVFQLVSIGSFYVTGLF